MVLMSEGSEGSEGIIRRPLNNRKYKNYRSSNRTFTTFTTFTRQINLAINTSLYLFPEIYRLPRHVMTRETRGQIIAWDHEHLYNILRESRLIDCYIRSHSDQEVNTNLVSIIFMDIDIENDLSRAKRVTYKIADRIKKLYNGKPHIQFSGAKGYHIIQPINPIKCMDLKEAKKFIKYVQREFAGRYIRYVDLHVLGDVRRIFRFPYSINSKTMEMVKPIQEWNGVRIYIDDLYYKFRLRSIDQEDKASKHRVIRGIRPEVRLLIKKAQREKLEHYERLAIMLELINNNYPDEAIIEVFKNQDDFNRDKIRYYIQHARSQGYKPFRRENLKKIIQR